MQEYYISTAKMLIQKEKVWCLLKDCFWSKNIPIEYVERFIKHSLCFGVYSKGSNNLIGFGRVISDYTTYAYICDIVIHPQHRRKGLGKNLLNSIMSHHDLQGLKTWTLRTTEESRKIYQQNGFLVADHPETQLEINDLEIYSRPTFINLHRSKPDLVEKSTESFKAKL